jgi:hypothetical protein
LSDKPIRDVDFGFIVARLNSTEPDVIVLKAHAFATRLLKLALTSLPQFPAGEKLGVRFKDMAVLCVAFGLLESDKLPALTMLDNLRNGVAHELGFYITEARQSELFDSLPASILDQTNIVDAVKGVAFPHPLRFAASTAMLYAVHAVTAANPKLSTIQDIFRDTTPFP